jgi:hypothetical protein
LRFLSLLSVLVFKKIFKTQLPTTEQIVNFNLKKGQESHVITSIYDR